MKIFLTYRLFMSPPEQQLLVATHALLHPNHPKKKNYIYQINVIPNYMKKQERQEGQ